MQRREQLLLGGLLAAVVIWQGAGIVTSAIFGPFQTKSEQLSRLRKSVTEKEDQLLLLVRARKSIADSKAISLPPDGGGKSKRPDALNAQRLYQQWLTDMAELCEFESTKVTPVRTLAKGNVYVSVVVKLEAQPRYGQLVRFLDQFYRTNLMHRISSLHITTKEFELDPYLTVTLEAEGLALIDATPRRTLFPQTELDADLTENATELQITEFEDFPKKPGFRIRIKNEFLTVVAIDGQKWTVERGIDQTAAASHPEGTLIELVRQKPDQPDRSLEEIRELISKNIFVKPAPPYRLKLAPISDKPFVKGKLNELTIGVLGYDASQGKPLFALVDTPPPGLRLEKTGKVSWRPGPDVKSDKYPVKFEIRHPSAPQGVLSETLTIRLREASAVPKLVDSKPQTVYLNRDWKYQPEISVADSPAAKFTWKLGGSPPEGMKIDSKSGEITWSPSDAVTPGEITLPVTVTDSDSPPQSTTLSLRLDIRDDEASFTRLDIIFKNGESKRAYLYDPSRNKKTELQEGDEFSVADIKGTVKQIGRKHIVLTVGQHDIRLNVGQSVREAQAKNEVVSTRSYE